MCGPDDRDLRRGDAELVGDLMYGLGDGVVAFTHLDRRGLIERAAAVRWAR